MTVPTVWIHYVGHSHEHKWKLNASEGSRNRRRSRWCIRFTCHTVFLSLSLIGIDAAPNQGEHYRSAKEREMTRFTERQSCISSVDFFFFLHRWAVQRIVQRKGEATGAMFLFWRLVVYKPIWSFFKELQSLFVLSVCEPWVLTALCHKFNFQNGYGMVIEHNQRWKFKA